MAETGARKLQSDVDIKKKAVKLVISHLKRKIPKQYTGSDYLNRWLDDMHRLLEKPEFVLSDYMEMRRIFNDVIERTVDEDMRFKLRDSWYSMGRALDKKVKRE